MKDVEETSADLNGSSASEFDPERYWRRDQWVISLKPNGASQEKSSNLVLPKRSVPQVLFKNLFIKDYEHIFFVRSTVFTLLGVIDFQHISRQCSPLVHSVAVIFSWNILF